MPDRSRLRPVTPEANALARQQVIDYLAEITAALRDGDIDADMVIVVLSVGDSHRLLRTGQRSWDEIGDALRYADHLTRAQQYGTETMTGDEWSRRKRQARLEREAAREKAKADRPYVCSCRDRFATLRGHTQHAAARLRRWRADQRAIAEGRMYDTRVYTADGMLRYSEMPEPEHRLAETYSPPAAPARLRAVE